MKSSINFSIHYFRIDDLAHSNQYSQNYAEQSVRPQSSTRDDYSRVQTKKDQAEKSFLKTEPLFPKTETIEKSETEKIVKTETKTETSPVKASKLPESNTIADMQILNKSLMKLNIQTFDSLSSFHLWFNKTAWQSI